MKTLYNYLKDTDFLLALSKEQNLEHFVKIIVLNFQEKPIREIQGRVTGGNVNIAGNSAVRRTANLSVFISEKDASYMEVNGIFSLNKKVKIEIGLTNVGYDRYAEHDIFWFPIGVYVISSLSTSHGTSGTTASMQLKDKMALLNGDCGGVIPASTVFHEYEELDPETGEYYIKRPTIVQIIREVVNHFGGEQLGKIIISDIDNRIKKVMKWTQSFPLYQYGNAAEGEMLLTCNKLHDDNETDESKLPLRVFEAGDDVGYVYTDFYFPGELIGDAGATVCTILDQIKNTLGNFEYFYDLDGNFIFREIKNYINTTKATVDLENLHQNDYIVNKRNGRAAYVFDNSEIITSYSNNPQYAQIKNDFIVWGLRESVEGKKLPIRYHLAIDTKPQPGNTYSCYYVEGSDKIVKAKLPIEYNSSKQFPKVGETERIYKDNSTNKVYLWDSENEYRYPAKSATATNCEVPFEEVETVEGVDGAPNKYYFISYYHYLNTRAERIAALQKELNESKNRYNKLSAEDKEKEKNAYEVEWSNYQQQINDLKQEPLTGSEKVAVTTTDWRTELYLSGAASTRFGTDSNYYYTELANEWPKLYDIQKGVFYDDVLKYPSEIDYYLDFIDSQAAISEFSVSNIGRRTKVINDDKINCIFEPEIPNYILIESGQTDTNAAMAECASKHESFVLVSSDVFGGLAMGGSHNSAYNMIRDLLYQYTQYNETISLQMLPMYFLEPNIRITVRDAESGIFGDYVINSISLPLDVSGQMSLSCAKALERI
jgi:hypothetical protein